ncbi:MAG: diguanylate cyclase [Propionivibrio sp.]
MAKAPRILVLDSSRVVRATLAKHLKDDFDVIEEASGESAWQALMLDSGISAVISGVHPLKLDAHDLLARLRASSIRRLRGIPFILVVSDLDNEVEREADRASGVAGFITKTMNKSAMLAALDGFFHPHDDRKPARDGKVPPSAERVVAPLAPDPLESPVPDEAGKPQSRDRFNSVLTKLSLADPLGEPVGILVFRIDNRAALIEQFGEEVAVMIDARFAKLLTSKVGPRDQIGHCFGDRLAIVSHDVDLRQGERFGKQVCRSLASGQITIRGQKVKLTASVGVASSSDDKVSSGSELFVLADQRLNQALVCGGNTVAIEYKAGCPMHCRDQQTAKLVEALSKQQDAAIRVHLGSFGLKILPVLRAMNQELSLGLSLSEIEQQLAQRARSEGTTV